MTPRCESTRRYGLRTGASIALPAVCLLTLACPSRTALGPAVRDELRAQYRGEAYYLRQSLYYGTFYSDEKRALVDARPFDQLRFMTGPDGDIIIPASPQGILPAGTKVQLVDLQFPTSAAIARRPLFTPRYNIWVVLRVSRYAGDIDLYRKGDHILVLGNTLREPAAIEAHLDALLSHEDLTPWLSQRSDRARLAIAEKRAEEGLTFEELVAALGFPDAVERRFEGETRIEDARFGADHIVLVNDVVEEIRSAGDPASAAPASAPASAPAGDVSS